ncbi:MAG: hypothetical protein GC200_11315 [Tepidisphaera sp.]|nr:hypothetical protein [Tepidisphaera sp.]
MFGVSVPAYAQQAPPRNQPVNDGCFTLLKDVPKSALTGRPNVRPVAFQAATVNWDVLKGVLATAPLEAVPQAQAPIVMSLPMPDGWMARFNVVESPMMEPGLAAKFPDMKTYQGQGIDDPTATVRFDYTPQGFHAFIRSANGDVFVDPYDGGDLSTVVSYFKSDLHRTTNWVCHAVDENPQPEPEVPAETPKNQTRGGGYEQRAGEFVTRHQYRLAVATTAEYTIFHSTLNGHSVNVTDGLAAVVTAVNRINEVYDTEVAVRFILVANNNLVIFTNPVTDGYANDGSQSDRDINQSKLDSGVGNGAYDVGHVFETGPGGIAFFRAPCSTNNKGKGLSGIDMPINDSFWVDYVAHEMGHQFDGRHNFNSCGGGPGDDISLAFEPGSGSTIMCYAGICGTDDLQPHSDVMFGQNSLERINAFIATTQCDTESFTGNHAPTISDAGRLYIIPSQTPFTLTPITYGDSDGDALTFSWEQTDTGAPVPLPLSDNGASPLFRVFPFTTTPSRTIPNLDAIRTNMLTVGEVLPASSRSLNFRCVVRDNHVGGGGTAWATRRLVVDPTSGPFRVTSPNTNVSWFGTHTITWDKANTDIAPVSCLNVRILLSLDSGATFPIVLASSVPNTGSASVVIPADTTPTTHARIKIEGINNIFFDESDVDFRIVAPPQNVAFALTGSNTFSDNEPNGNRNGGIDPGENNIAVYVQVINNGLLTGTNVRGTLSTVQSGVTVTTPTAFYPNLATNSPQVNLTPYIISISPNFACNPTGTINLRLTLTSDQGGTLTNVPFTFPIGTLPLPIDHVFSFRGPAVPIPDFPGPAATINIPVSGLTDPVTAVKVSFDGSLCTAQQGATTVGIEHSYVSDLQVTLTSPTSGLTQGRSVIIMNRPGYVAPTSQNPLGGDNSGNNFCSTYLEDNAASGLSIQNVTAGDAPFSNHYVPNASFSPFRSLSGNLLNGVWTLSVQDLSGGDTGNVRAFSLIITTQKARFCQPAGSPCDPDYNQDGAVDQGDVDYLINVIAGGANPSGRDPDFNQDGVADQTDVDALVNAVAGGGCP